MKVDVLPGLTGLDEASWNSLLDRSAAPSAFLTWTWQTEWARAFAPHHALQILAVRGDDGSLAGLLPLYEDGPERLRVLGGVDVSDYLDLIAPAGTEEDVWHALLQHRAVQRVEWDLHAVRAASPTAEILPRIAPSWGLRAVAEIEERCPVLALPATWDGYLATLSGKDRHELKRKARKLERELAAVSVRSHAGAEGWDEALGQFLTLHRLSKVGKARFMDERMEQFFRAALAAFAERDAVRLWFLDTASGPIAAFVTIEWDGTVGLYNSGFAPDRAALSPGVVLLAQLIRDAIGRGREKFDFLRGEERYKYEFDPVAQAVYRVTIQ